MITSDKIEIYTKFNGDDDMFVRAASEKDKAIIGDDDWNIISVLLQRISLIKKGFAAKLFEDETEKMLLENVDCMKSINKLKIIA